MATIRELKKRLQGVKATRQLTGAMRTVSSAKYARLSSSLEAYRPYAQACRDMVRAVGGLPADTPRDDGEDMIVLIAGNRGLCGGYNSELISMFLSEADVYGGTQLFVVCGKVAAEACREKGISVYREFSLSDEPTFTEAAELSRFLCDLYSRGEVRSVRFLIQKFRNMLVQVPSFRDFLPVGSGGHDTPPDTELIFEPDADTVLDSLRRQCLDADVYSVLLECACGAQAATLTAMRSAYDNAGRSAAALELDINRRRQSEVTSNVIETASENRSNGEW